MRLDNEWIETDGHGAACAGTVAGKVHRRCHGLWMPGGRHGRRKLMAGFALYYRHPEMLMPLTSYWLRGRWNTPDAWPTFRAFPCPGWTWAFDGDVALRMELLFPRDAVAGLALRFRLEAPANHPSLRLVMQPLLHWSSLGDVRSDFAVGLDDEEGRSPLWLLSSEPCQFSRDGEPLGEAPATGADGTVHQEELFGGPRIHLPVSGDRATVLLLTDEEAEALPSGVEEAIEGELARRRALPFPDGLAGEELPALAALAADRHRLDADAIAGAPSPFAWAEEGTGARELLIALPFLHSPGNDQGEAMALLRRLLPAADGPEVLWLADRICLYAGGTPLDAERDFLLARAHAPYVSPTGSASPEQAALRLNLLCCAVEAAGGSGDPAAGAKWNEEATRLRAEFAQRLDGMLAAEPPAPELPLALTGFLLRHNIVEGEERQAALLRKVGEHFLTPRGILRPLDDGTALAEPELLAGWAAGLAAHPAVLEELLPTARGVLKELLFHFEQEACVGQVSACFTPRPPRKPMGAVACPAALAGLLALLRVVPAET